MNYPYSKLPNLAVMATVISLVFFSFNATQAVAAGNGTAPGITTPKPICMLDMTFGNPELSPDWLRTANKEAVKIIMDNSAPDIDDEHPEVGFHKGEFMASGDLDPEVDKALPFQTAKYRKEDWQRDGGITANALVEVLLDDEFLRDDVFNDPTQTLSDRKKIVLQSLMDNLAYQKKIQSLDSVQLGGAGVYDETVNGQTVRRYHPAYGLAKRGKDFSEPLWMNPQIDGSGYEQKSNLRLASYIWDRWTALFNKYSTVRTNLSRDDIYKKSENGNVDNNNSIIKNFFEYIYHNWRASTYEMWEEVKSRAVDPGGRGEYSGGHFATIGALQAVMLIEGPEFTAKVGDADAGKEYRRAGIFDMEPFLKSNFWDAKYKVIKPSLDLVDDSRPDANGHPKFIENDPRVFNGVSAAAPVEAQVLIGLCHMKSPAFMLTSDMVMSTEYQSEMLFKGFYPINHGKNVVLWGRYINDIYSGMFEKENKVVDGQSVQVPIYKSQIWPFTTQYVAEAAEKRAEEWASFGNLNHIFAYALKSRGDVKIDGELAKVLFKLALKENPQQALDTFDSLPNSWSLSGFTINSSDSKFNFLKGVVARNRLVVNDLNVDYLNYVFEQVGYPDRVTKGQRIATTSSLMKKLITAQVLRGDLILKEVLNYKDKEGGLSEQLNPDTDPNTPAGREVGAQRQRSAPKLTWSSGVVIRFSKARKRALARASEIDTTFISNTEISR